MAVLHYEDGSTKEFLTSKNTTRLFGYKKDGKRPILIELNKTEWHNPNFHFRFALNAVHPAGDVVLNEELT